MIEIPEHLTHAQSLSLLIGDFPLVNLGEIRNIDDSGEVYWKNREITKAYFCKATAARNYDRFDMDLSAGFCYDKAGKDAILLGFIHAAFLCRVKAITRYWKSLKTKGFNIPLEGLTNEDLRNQYLSQMNSHQGNVFRGLIYNALNILELDEKNGAIEFENGIPKRNKGLEIPRWMQQDMGVLSVQARVQS